MKLSFFLSLLFLPSLAFSEVQELNPITFGGGVDYKTDCSDIADSRACDSNNMISDYAGTVQKRFGSERSIDQAISSVAVKGLYRAYYSTGTTVFKATLMINNGIIYTDTTTTVTGHVWRSKKTGLDKNQNYAFKQQDKYIIIAGDSLNDPVLRYDISKDSVTENFTNDGGANSAYVTFKHEIFSKNYFLGANIKEMGSGTTYYPSRVHYSLLITSPTAMSFTSMTVLRWFDVPSNGEEITGMGEIENIHIFSPSSISKLEFDILNLGSLGGDQSLIKVVQGFGCIAPRTLVNTGKLYIFLSKDGIRIYDPSARDVLTEETKLVSTNIEPIIKRILENGTHRNTHGFFYAKRNWYIFSYEDPFKYPKNKPNSTLICDLNTGEWFPMSNWLPECFADFDNISDKQELIYGDTNDGYVYYVDQERFQNDARKEIVIDNCDVTGKWKGATSNNTQHIEGTGAIKLSMVSPTFNSSATYMGTINLSEWQDKNKATINDKLSFKVYPSSLTNMTSLRIDLELNTRTDTFDTFFTSVTLSSASLTGGTSNWTTVEIPLSSFPILSSWVDLSSGVLPFANSPTFYGMRIFSTGTGWHALTIDDIRFIKDKETELNAFRLTKQFNLGTNAEKTWRQAFINCDKPATSKFYIDYYYDFGEFSNRETVSNTFDKDIFVTGYKGQEGIFKLDGNDFTLLDSTVAADSSVFAIRSITSDKDYVYGADQYNNRIMKFKRNDLTVLVSSVGSSGSGGNNFSMPFQMALNNKNNVANLHICDFKNHSLKIYNPDNMKYRKSFGDLGSGATNFYYPTGIAVDDNFVFIAQDGNSRLQQWKIGSNNSLTYVNSVILNLNTVGNTRLAVDQKSVYVYYSKISEDNLLYSELWFEQRNKSDLKLVTKSRILPKNVSVVSSTYSVMGDIGVNDDFVYLTFTDGLNPKQWIQTSAADWNSGTIGMGLDTTTVSGDIILSSQPVLSSMTFVYTGSVKTYVVPSGINSVTVELYGARGGYGRNNDGTNSQPGYGGYIKGTFNVKVGDNLNFYVGNQGGDWTHTGWSQSTGGWNGGGDGTNQWSGGGGGATDVRINGSTWSVRQLVAGGGGGGVQKQRGGDSYGGGGGYPNGIDGSNGTNCQGGQGGSQSVGGWGGYGDLIGFSGSTGTIGFGGISTNAYNAGGGGGGGYYGGGGGGRGSQGDGNGGGGGGGSSFYASTCVNVVTISSVNAGNGYAILYIPVFTSTFTSKVFNTGKAVNSWNTVNVDETLNNGTIGYRIFSDTDSTIDIYNPATFIASQTVTNGSIPTIPFNQYVTVSADFKRNLSTYTPTLHNFTLNFNEANLLKTYGKYSNQDIGSLMDNSAGGDFEPVTRNYYFQKRLKDGVNFPLIREYVSTDYIFSVTSNGLTYKPKRQNIVKDIGGDSSTYIQFKFSEDELDNSFKLYKLSPLLNIQSIRERP